MVIATGLNQRHVRALADAVSWQLRQAAQELLHQQPPPQEQQQQQQQQQQPRQVLAGLKRQLKVLGDPSSDWCVLDAGGVAVHVLTQRARRFYALEGLWGGPQGADISWLAQTGPELHTKDTIGRPSCAPPGGSHHAGAG
jgi:ribosomal silencing factor RsfS